MQKSWIRPCWHTRVLLHLISWTFLQESADHSDAEDNQDGKDAESNSEDKMNEKKDELMESDFEEEEEDDDDDGEEEDDEDEGEEDDEDYSDSSNTICMSSDSETEVWRIKCCFWCLVYVVFI